MYDFGKSNKLPVYRGVLARFPRAIKELAKTSAFGAEKHQVDITSTTFLELDPDMYADAGLRHTLDRLIEGDINEADGGLYHRAQKAWNALAELETFLHRQEKANPARITRVLGVDLPG
jgi:hypothetical protein